MRRFIVICLFNSQFEEVAGVMATFTTVTKLAVMDILAAVATATELRSILGLFMW